MWRLLWTEHSTERSTHKITIWTKGNNSKTTVLKNSPDLMNASDNCEVDYFYINRFTLGLNITLIRDTAMAVDLILPFICSHVLAINWWGKTNIRISASLVASFRSGMATWNKKKNMLYNTNGTTLAVKLIVNKARWYNYSIIPNTEFFFMSSMYLFCSFLNSHI